MPQGKHLLYLFITTRFQAALTKASLDKAHEVQLPTTGVIMTKTAIVGKRFRIILT